MAQNWRFYQGQMTLQTAFRCVNKKGQTKHAGAPMVVELNSSCRESLVSIAREKMYVAASVKNPGSAGWEQERRRRVFDIDLDHAALKQPGCTEMSLYVDHFTARSEKAYHDFVYLCDATAGLLNVLLNPERYTGDWWRTLKEEVHTGESGIVHYYGIDNTVLRHPALLSLYTGIIRQCALMSGNDIAEEALAAVDRRAVTGALTTSDEGRALELFQKMKPWVEVSMGGGTGRRVTNFPVPKGSFSKLIDLHRAIYTYGFEKTFDEDMMKAWRLDAGPYQNGYHGIHEYMGQQGQNSRGGRIKALAKKAFDSYEW